MTEKVLDKVLMTIAFLVPAIFVLDAILDALGGK